MKVNISISPGELYDRLSILEIKSHNIDDRHKKKRVIRELKLLKKEESKLIKSLKNKSKLPKQKKLLLITNNKLWKLEDKVRKYDHKKDFGKKFVKSAKLIYKYNDMRFKIKNDINLLFGYFDGEVKEYKIEKRK